MKVLVTGGAASGKSAYAEALACRLSPTRSYLATMGKAGSESAQRIERHRRQRERGNFHTIEREGTLAGDAPDAQHAAGSLLLDDVGNLVSCALFDAQGNMADPAATLERLDAEFAALCEQYAHVVVVGNQVGADGQSFADESGTWQRTLGALCAKMAARCDVVVEVAAGLPLFVKGSLPIELAAEGGAA